MHDIFHIIRFPVAQVPLATILFNAFLLFNLFVELSYYFTPALKISVNRGLDDGSALRYSEKWPSKIR